MLRTNRVKIVKYQDGSWNNGVDVVVREVPITVFVNGEELVTLLATPEHLDELALGHLKGEGFLDSDGDLLGVEVDPGGNWVRVTTTKLLGRGLKLYGRRMLTSGCGRGTIFYHSLDALDVKPVSAEVLVDPAVVLRVVRRLESVSELFRETGGVHGAGLATVTGEVLVFREDIGRHNAVDKIVGHCLLSGVVTENKILVTSGRVSSEIALKAAKLGISVLISPSAPTELAIALAQRLMLTVVGFARGRRLSVYSAPHRLAGAPEW